MKKALFSYDYELFFGRRSGTVQKTLIAPTNEILRGLERSGFKGNFFVDWQMLKYLKEANTERTLKDLDLIEEQLRDIVRRGHRIELHIHPHWVDAKYNGDGTWDYSNFKHYSLNSFEEDVIVAMFKEGKELLTKIAMEVDPDYQIVAFRAGGWAVQPFSILDKAFKKVGIRIDSSVAYGAYNKNDFSYYDFRSGAIKNQTIYRFNDDVLKPVSDGYYLEVPISSFRRYNIYRVLDGLNRKITKTAIKISDGTHKRSDLPPSKAKKRAMVSLSGRSPLSNLISFLVQKSNIVTFIDHPKDYTNSHNITLAWLSKIAQSVTYQELGKLIK